jgi:hypothetical protein
MRVQLGILVSLLVLALAGCNQQPVSAAPMGAPPAIRIPVGPVPGPKPENMELPTNPYQGDQVALVGGRRLFIC